MKPIKEQLITYFEQLRDKCKKPENKEAIQKEIDRLKGLTIRDVRNEGIIEELGVRYGENIIP